MLLWYLLNKLSFPPLAASVKNKGFVPFLSLCGHADL